MSDNWNDLPSFLMEPPIDRAVCMATMINAARLILLTCKRARSKPQNKNSELLMGPTDGALLENWIKEMDSNLLTFLNEIQQLDQDAAYLHIDEDHLIDSMCMKELFGSDEKKELLKANKENLSTRYHFLLWSVPRLDPHNYCKGPDAIDLLMDIYQCPP